MNKEKLFDINNFFKLKNKINKEKLYYKLGVSILFNIPTDKINERQGINSFNDLIILKYYLNFQKVSFFTNNYFLTKIF